MCWKQKAITYSEVITDAWEITKIYAARLAEWVLFLCMVVNIIEILPGVALGAALVNGVLATQAITLDIAGFGLASMAEQAEKDEDRRTAKLTGWFLIGLMLVTLINVSVGLLFPEVVSYTLMIDKGLILVRVGMTVIYGHVVHSLRRSVPPIPQPNQPDYVAIIQSLEQKIEDLAAQKPTIDYVQIAANLQPALNDFRSNIVAQIPQNEPLDYSMIASQIQPLLLPVFSQFSASLQEEISTRINPAQLALEVTTILSSVDKVVHSLEDETVDGEGDDSCPQERPQIHLVSSTELSTEQRTTKRQPVPSDVVKKIRRHVLKNREVTSTELAEKYNVSRSYAGKLKLQILAEQPA